MSEQPGRPPESKRRFRPVDFRVFRMTQAARVDTGSWPQWVKDAYDSTDAAAWRLFPSKYPTEGYESMELNIVGPNGSVRVYHGWYIVSGSTGEMFTMSPETYASLMVSA